MRTQITFITLIIAGTLFGTSCSKKNDGEPVVMVDEKNLTGCPLNADCQYLFTERADVNSGPGTFTTGSYRVFWNSTLIEGRSAVLYIKAPMAGNSFSLNQADVTSGKVELSRSCPACYFVASKIVDGYVKGINLTPDKPADQTKWIIEAQIIFDAMYGPSIKDTVSVKQYFYPNFVYN